ncbi:MAG: portal protein, partial [Planctomycetota bacterium]
MAKSKRLTNEALHQRLDEMVRIAFDATRDWSQIWQDGLDYVFNNQLTGQRRRKGWDRIQTNYIYPAVAQTMAIIAQRRPRIVAQPVEPSDTPAASQWGRVLQWQFDKVLRMRSKLMAAALDGAVFGHYVAKTLWESKARWDVAGRRWIGQPRVAIVHPQFFGADPDAESIDDATFIVCKRRVPVEYATARWPKHDDAIEQAAAAETSEDYLAVGNRINHKSSGERDSDTDGVEGRLVDLINRRFSPSAIPEGRDAAGGYVTIEEIYFRDLAERKSKDEREVPYAQLAAQGLIVEDEDGYWVDAKTGKPFKERQTEVVRDFDEPVYPFGRYVLRIGAGSERVILNDAEDKQVWPYVNWPYTVGVNASLPHVWQGLNQVEMARGHQDWLNITMSHMANYVRQFSDPIVLVEQGALQGSEDNANIASKIAARAGAIWKMARGKLDRAQRVPPPPMSESLIAFYQLMGEGIKDQLGIQDITMGKQTSAPTTATEVWQLAVNSQNSTTFKSILLDAFTERVMSGVLELDQANMDPDEQVRI